MGSEWKEVIFSEVIEINPNRELSKGQEYPFIDMQAVEPYTRKVSNIKFRKYNGSGSKFKNGDTLFARITPCLENGKTAYVKELKNGEKGFGSTEFLVFSGKEGVTDNLFVYYLSRSPEIREYAVKNMIGTSGRQRVDKSCFNELRIKLPPLPEQQKIASILSAFDDKIELNNEMNKTLEEIAQAIFKHWFIDFEFPNENGEPYKSSGGEFVDSELGPIPKGWKVVKLREILDNICDSVKPGKEIEGLPYVPIDIVERKSIALKQFKSWEEAKSSLIKFKKDDILLGAMRVYFHKVSIAPCEGVTRKTCFVLRPKKRFDLSYTLLLIFQDDTIKFADAHSKGTTMPYAVWDNGLAEMKIALPTEKIRQRFNELLYPIISKIRDCIFENLTLSQLRDTLLPKLISGEIRVM